MQPDTRVFVQFSLEASGVAFFTLDDDVQGVLDGPFGLGGDVLVDVTQFVASISIGRGKSRELDRFTAGQATVTFHNDNRWFDPFFIDSPYFQQFVPKREIVITTNGTRQYTGFIEDIDLRYELGNKSYATITCSDAFSQLSATQLDAYTNVAEFSGERIITVLNKPEVNWSIDERDIDTGGQLLQADVVDENTNVLQYLQLVESSEPGALFIAKDGKITFRDRTNYPSITPTIAFADDATPNAVAYRGVEVIYGSENLYNRIVITRKDGTPQIADSEFSQMVYGIQAFNQDGLLMETDADALQVAEFLISKFDLPELRFSSVSISLHDKDLETQNKILGLEINDVIQIVFTPNNIPPAIDEFGLITGISHTIGIDQHLVTFDFGSAQGFPFRLDNEIYGVLDGIYPLAFW